MHMHMHSAYTQLATLIIFDNNNRNNNNNKRDEKKQTKNMFALILVTHAKLSKIRLKYVQHISGQMT